LKTSEAIDALIMGFEYEVKSELLRHEICYSLGQMEVSKKKKAVVQAFLEKVVSEPSHSDFVKHEAIEALEVFNEDLAMKVLEELKDKQSGIVYETYYLKKKQIEWEKETDRGKSEGIEIEESLFDTKEPVVWYNYKADQRYADVGFLQEILLDNVTYDIFERYRALITLREINTEDSLMAICQCFMDSHLNCSDLLKHQAAFVLR
jgi:deoxyhypusine monooxygenase